MALCGVIWRYEAFLAFYGDLWRYAALCDIMWSYFALFGDMWRYLALCGVMWLSLRFVALFGDMSR